MAKAKFRESITQNEETGLPNLPDGFYWHVGERGSEFFSYVLTLKKKRTVKKWYHLRDWYVWDQDRYVSGDKSVDITWRDALWIAAWRMERKRQFQEWKSQQPEYAPIPLGDYPPNTMRVD